MKVLQGPALQVMAPLKVMEAFQGSFFETPLDLAGLRSLLLFALE